MSMGPKPLSGNRPTLLRAQSYAKPQGDALPALSSSARRGSRAPARPPESQGARPFTAGSAEPAERPPLCVADLYTLEGVPYYQSDGGSELRLATHMRTLQPALVKAVSLRPPPPVAPRSTVDLWRRLDSRHVVALYDSFTTPTHVIVCMEAVQGLSAAQVMQTQGLSPDETRDLFKQVAHGVAAMHRAGVCHRSLSLDAIMLQEGAVPRAVIVSLDTLAEAKQLTKRCTPLPYCPPEALPPKSLLLPSAAPSSLSPARGSAATAPGAVGGEEGGSYSGCALDVWSLGVVLHTLLCGQLPFEAQASRKYTPPAQLPDEARELLR
ncbi:kinase-like domain-containing protein [Pavlovales sp. CCMP2436]|nr:kinase-like domain-containing protein [Pavlovales sp. CCMP2436]